MTALAVRTQRSQGRRSEGAMLVDYLCNAFTPDRVPIWEAAVAGLALKIRPNEFIEAEGMVARMDAHGYATLLLPAADLGDDDFTPVAARWDEVAKLVEQWPGRFAALACIDPTRGIDAVRELERRLGERFVAGCYIH